MKNKKTKAAKRSGGVRRPRARGRKTPRRSTSSHSKTPLGRFIVALGICNGARKVKDVRYLHAGGKIGAHAGAEHFRTQRAAADACRPVMAANRKKIAFAKIEAA